MDISSVRMGTAKIPLLNGCEGQIQRGFVDSLFDWWSGSSWKEEFYDEGLMYLFYLTVGVNPTVIWGGTICYIHR